MTPLDIEHPRRWVHAYPFLSKQLYVVIYPRYHTRIALCSRSHSQETVQRKVSGEKNKQNKTERSVWVEHLEQSFEEL